MSALYCLTAYWHLGDNLQFQMTLFWLRVNKSGDWSGLRCFFCWTCIPQFHYQSRQGMFIQAALTVARHG
jgi:hypothetical protein